MAKIKVSTKKKIVVAFQERELRNYPLIQATIVAHQDAVFVDFALPYLTWQGHDRRVVEDIIDLLKKIGNYSARAKGNQSAGWKASTHKPTISTTNKIRIPVYARHSEPYVQAERGADGFVKWSVMGHAFNDDLPSVAAYVAALTRLMTEVKNKNL